MNRNSIFVGSVLDLGHYYLPEMAEAAGFQNKKSARVAAIEMINLDTPNDERDARHYDINATASTAFPYLKTRSGALQSHTMPWDYRNRQFTWGSVGLISTLLGLACKII